MAGGKVVEATGENEGGYFRFFTIIEGLDEKIVVRTRKFLVRVVTIQPFGHRKMLLLFCANCTE
ncbi:MAG: hypothetical protein R2784_06050 [Saprospiraceae bacterium]